MPASFRLRNITSMLRLPGLLAALLLACSGPVLAQDDDEDFFDFDEGEAGATAEIADPFEDFNRAMFSFNDKAYRHVLKPVARGLRVLPLGVRTSSRNFFENLGTPISAISALLQGDLPNTGSELARFGINSTLGILGLFDPATGMGLIQDDEDMGQTFAVWGADTGPYLVLPLLGSSNLRDFFGFGVNAILNPVNTNLDASDIIAIQLLRAEVALSLDQDTYEALYDSALDPYVFFRSALSQNRAGAVAR
jgi:phospholipid-binding lipoprotein MlaA